MGQNLFVAAYSTFQLGSGSRALPPGYQPQYEYKLGGNGGNTDSDTLKEIDCTGLLSQSLAGAGYQGYGRLRTGQLIGDDGKFSTDARTKFDVAYEGKAVNKNDGNIVSVHPPHL